MNSRAVVGRLGVPDDRRRGRRSSGRRRRAQAAPDDPNLQAMSLGDPKVFIALVTWAIYSFALVSRRTMGWTAGARHGCRRSGFAIVLLNFLPVSYFVTTSHTFQ